MVPEPPSQEAGRRRGGRLLRSRIPPLPLSALGLPGGDPPGAHLEGHPPLTRNRAELNLGLATGPPLQRESCTLMLVPAGRWGAGAQWEAPRAPWLPAGCPAGAPAPPTRGLCMRSR